jgi:hypothetical protein
MALLTPPKPVPWWRLSSFLFNQSLAHKCMRFLYPFPLDKITLLFLFHSLPPQNPPPSFSFFPKKKLGGEGQKGGCVCWLKRRSNTPPCKPVASFYCFSYPHHHSLFFFFLLGMGVFIKKQESVAACLHPEENYPSRAQAKKQIKINK